MTRLQSYIDRFGAVAGPKLYHAIQSRSALIGANTRRRRAISGLTGRPVSARRAPTSPGAGTTPLLAEAGASDPHPIA